MPMRIDAHHHFWSYDPGQYGWIDDSMSVLRRDFLPDDLRRETNAAGVDAVISVQARQTLEETQWLLHLAGERDWIAGVVGWLPLADPAAEAVVDRFADDPHLKGVRHVVQDEPDDDYILGDAFNRGVSLLQPRSLVYDVLVFERHLPQVIEFVDRHPRQTFVLDHIAKPRIRDGVLSPWKERIVDLARRGNVYCKLSGLVTETEPHNGTERELRPYMDVVLDAFGPGRLMFGSDWPVVLLACPYGRWAAIVETFVAGLASDERDRVMGGTAAAVYGVQ